MLSSKNIQRLAGTTLLTCALTASAAFASSHREAPQIAGDPTNDGTDFYMFRSYEPGRSNYVTIIANYNPLQDAFGGPNYFALNPDAFYHINIDSDGDAKADQIFSFKFNQSLPGGNGIALNVGGQNVAIPLKNAGGIDVSNNNALNFNETYNVSLITGINATLASSGIFNANSGAAITDAANGSAKFTKPFDYIGNKTFTSKAGYESYANQYIRNVRIPGCAAPGKVFVGQRNEGFAVNLGRIFDLVNLVPIEAGAFPGGIDQSAANNTVANKNITTIALEVPIACLKGNGNGVIGGWTSAYAPKLANRSSTPTVDKRYDSTGLYQQVSRLGMPLVNEVVIGLKDKDKFNASLPQADGQFASYVTNPTLPALLNILFLGPVNSTLGTSIPDLAPTNFPRRDLVAAFLTGFPGLNQQSKVIPSEMLRLNTNVPATPASIQKNLGVLADDLAGFPNGRRPGDDVVDAELRVAMGRLCHPVVLGGVTTSLGLCNPADAAVGTVPFTDGAPVNASTFQTVFPYLNTPIAGAM